MRKWSFIWLVFIVCSAASPSLYAGDVYHQLSIGGVDTVFYVDQSEEWTEEEKGYLTLFFQDSQTEGRAFGFHFYQDPGFSMTNMADVMDYGKWFPRQIYGEEASISNVSLKTLANSQATYAGTITKQDGVKIYFFVFMKQLSNHLVFGTINTSLISRDAAMADCQNQLGHISWTE